MNGPKTGQHSGLIESMDDSEKDTAEKDAKLFKNPKKTLQEISKSAVKNFGHEP